MNHQDERWLGALRADLHKKERQRVRKQRISLAVVMTFTVICVGIVAWAVVEGLI